LSYFETKLFGSETQKRTSPTKEEQHFV